VEPLDTIQNRETVYTCVQGLILRWRFWGEQYVVYDLASGSTHMLDALSGDILLRLYQSPLTKSELIEMIVASSDAESESFLDEFISSLKRLELLA